MCHGEGLGRSTRASFRCFLRPLQRKATLFLIGRLAQALLAPLLFIFCKLCITLKPYSIVPYILFLSNFSSIFFLPGTTIHACRSSSHHIVALKRNPNIFNKLFKSLHDPKPPQPPSSPRPRPPNLDKPPLQKRQRTFAVSLCA